jgi:hypothetical protein
MKKKIFIFSIILTGFIIGFLLTFPLKSLALRFLFENNIKFSEIKGNSLELEIKNLQKDDIQIPVLKLKNFYFFQLIELDKENKIKIYPIQKKVNLDFKNFVLNKYLKDENIDIELKKTSLNLYLEDKNILLNGDGTINLNKLEGFELNGTKIKFKLKDNPKEKFSEIKADIEGEIVKGKFEGKIVLNIEDLDNSYIEGVFRGELLNQAVEKNIKQELSTLF